MVWLHQDEGSTDNFLEPGVYQGVIDDIRTKSVRVKYGERQGEMADLLVWKISVEQDDLVKSIEGTSSLSLHKRSKAYKWIKAITGSEPSDKFNTDELRGIEIEFRVDVNKNGFSVVDDILKKL